MLSVSESPYLTKYIQDISRWVFCKSGYPLYSEIHCSYFLNVKCKDWAIYNFFYFILSSFYFKFYVLIYRSWMGHKIMSLGEVQMVSRFFQIRYPLEKFRSCRLDLQLFSCLNFLLGLQSLVHLLNCVSLTLNFSLFA